MNKISIVVLLLASFLTPVAAQRPTGDISKTPFETVDVSLDFINRAPSGVTLYEVKATNTESGMDSTSTIITVAPDTPVPAVYPASSRVIIRVRNGSVGEVYNIAIRVTRSDTGERLEGNILLHIVQSQ